MITKIPKSQKKTQILKSIQSSALSINGGEEWKYTNSFNIEDPPKVALVATEAYKYVRLRENDSQ